MFKDIWYVTFDNDVELILLEEALNAHNRFREPHEINVIVNEYDNHSSGKANRIRRRIKRLPQDNIKVNVYIPDDILTDEEIAKIHEIKDFSGFGWVSQQYLKLAVYRKSNAKFSYIFDCKNISVKPKAIEQVSHNHNFRINPLGWDIHFENYKNYLRRQGILKNTDLVYTHSSVSTPFILNNEILSSMFDTLDVFDLIFLQYKFLKKGEIENFLKKSMLASEIILYYSYMDYQGLDIDTDSKFNPNHYVPSGVKRPWMTDLNLEDWIRQHNYDYDDGLVDFPVTPYKSTYYLTVHRRMLEEELHEDPTLQRFKKFIRRSLRDY